MSTPARRRLSTPRELARVGDRLSFVYLERCVVHRDANAITADDADGTTHIPSATIGTLLLGPGTRITHQAMSVLGECGAGVVWVGENGVRYYAAGRALTRSAALAEAQATAWANRRSRLDVARAMYRTRYPDEDPSGLTRLELLGHEGQRVKEAYRRESLRTGVRWSGRHYVPGDFASGDAPNQAVTAAAQCLYGIAHAVVGALGCSPALGFVHSGHELSFVLDVADLYKTEVGIPAAFDAALEGPDDIASRTRRALRERIRTTGLLDRCVDDIKRLLAPYARQEKDGTEAAATADDAVALVDALDAEEAENAFDGADESDRVELQTDRGRTVPGGRNYSDGADR
ncbi:type I-E CRISPR-associated endonuclease Cas1e [Kitasatospora sp. NBC_01287]|uniref:type I-E CRISPR-associated endonuclease Cas1e n=1 Tax=Kitasatospora sp. NBC_01287 TaxID=2903573 RepID=UPI002256A6DB|nr:type I-E CRISPR-associated endonuclease Cas1e [Kitasatospora sp. NBC_01287]MCX4744811.1 type I-E CRISPR-associated endonuclease Cas1e [Kitasatospora sp. NBC_01287]